MRMAQPRVEEHDQFQIGGKFRLVRRIGAGSFGTIYLGVSVSSGQEVAVKMESFQARHPQLQYETKLYKVLHGATGFPRLRWHGQEKGYHILVMDLLGPNLEDLLNFCGRKLSVKTVLMIADQMISRLEFLHSKNFLHRDIKPDNFLMGMGKSCHTVFLIDFGLSKRYRDTRTRHHIPFTDDKHLTGTARYASLSAHLGNEQSRRDDMEALGNVLVYLLRGNLPWQGLMGGNKKQKYEKIREKKRSTSVEELCKGLPAEFIMYINYCRNLRFEEVPDYTYLRQLFRILFRTLNHQYDFCYDWKLLNKEPGSSGQKRPASEAAVVEKPAKTMKK